jgi:hypothetical protein
MLCDQITEGTLPPGALAPGGVAPEVEHAPVRSA